MANVTKQTEARAARMGQKKRGALDDVCECVLLMETTCVVASVSQEPINMGE